MGESERRQYRSKASFGDDAPPNTLSFPKRANLTVIEILAFLPNRINCADVVYRMISNGGTRKSIHAIVNTHRDLEAEWSANCCGEAMYKAMQKAGYTKWTITQHNVWHDSRKALWDSNRLDVGDLRPAPGPAARSVSFRSLAENVRTMPQGDDTLDLTRMVLYCVQIAEDGWKYPRDYEELLDLLGGPAAVREANTDGAVFRRWENRRPPPPLPKPAPLLRGIEVLGGCKKTRRKSSAVAGRTGTETGSRKLSPAPRSLAKHGAARDGTAAIPENMDMVEVMYVSDPDSELSTHYVRQVAEYMPPPPQPNVEGLRTIPTLALAFQAEGFVGESDIYSAYAFGGPRHAPPYRYLYQITQPHPRDVSGWAENLRWAFEQRVLFSKDFPQVAEWDESSAHMARIERERTQRVWASDELLEQLQ